MADNIISLFQKYNRVTFPREGINTLDVYTEMKDKDLNSEYMRLGPISDLVKGNATKPEANVNMEAFSYIDKSARGVDASIGVSLLDGIINKLGLGNLSLSGTYKNAHKFDMSFLNSLIDSVDLSKVLIYLKSLSPNEVFLSQIGGKRVYLIYEIIKSKAIGVIEYDEKGHAIDAKTKIKDIVDLGIQARISKTNDKEIIYDGKKNLTFGFLPIPIWISIEAGKYIFNTDIFSKVPNMKTLAAELPAWTGIEAYDNTRNFNLLFESGDYLIPSYDSPGAWIDLKEKE